MPRLVVESGVDQGMVFPLVQETTSLGRSAQNTIQIIDKRMSRHHVQFLRRGPGAILRDLGSKNGTYLNSVRITGDHPLSHGDRVRIGETVLLFEEEKDDPASSSSSSSGVKLVQEDWSNNAARSHTMVAGAAPLNPEQLAAAGAAYKQERREHVQLLFQVADAIRTILDLDELLERLMELIYVAVEPDTGVIFLVDDKTNRFYPRITRDLREDGSIGKGDVTVSRTIIDRAAQERISILVSDAAQDERFSGSESVILNRIRSAICAPIIYKEQVLGVLYVSSQRFMTFTEEDMELLTGIANQAAMAISNVRLHDQLVAQQKLEREMEIARTIQMNLLPKEYPEFEHFDISGMSLPAKHVGGDYYDFVALGGGRWAVAVADVSGKGVPAALLTTTVRASMQVLAKNDALGIRDLMRALNATTCRDSLNNMFVTMVYAIVHDAERRVEFVNAGHAHPLLFLPDGTEQPLVTGGSFLGIDEEMEFDSESVEMPPDSVLVFFTDGVTDTTDAGQQQFGTDRFRAIVKENLGKSAEEIRDAIYQETLAFRGAAPQFDDFTLIVLKCLR